MYLVVINSILIVGDVMVYVWLGIVLILIFIEAMTVNLTTIWFVVSGIVAMLLTFFTDIFLIQFSVFVILGIILLITTRPFLQKKFGNKVRTNLDRVIDMTGTVTKEITENNYGEVKVDGKYWTALADRKIKVDTVIEVLEIDGVKLKVREKKEDE